MANSHSWVELTYLPVSVETDDSGNLVVTASKEGIELAEEDRAVYCLGCKLLLTHTTFGAECEEQLDPAKFVGDHNRPN